MFTSNDGPNTTAGRSMFCLCDTGSFPRILNSLSLRTENFPSQIFLLGYSLTTASVSCLHDPLPSFCCVWYSQEYFNNFRWQDENAKAFHIQCYHYTPCKTTYNVCTEECAMQGPVKREVNELVNIHITRQ